MTEKIGTMVLRTGSDGRPELVLRDGTKIGADRHLDVEGKEIPLRGAPLTRMLLKIKGDIWFEVSADDLIYITQTEECMLSVLKGESYLEQGKNDGYIVFELL